MDYNANFSIHSRDFDNIKVIVTKIAFDKVYFQKVIISGAMVWWNFR